MNDNITEINKNTFWKLIQSAKETQQANVTRGTEMAAMIDLREVRSGSMGTAQAQ